MKNYILFLLLIMCLNIHSQNRYETDSIKAYLLIEKEIVSLKEKGIIESNIISLFDDTGKIVIAWKEKEKYRAIRIYYKGRECNRSKKQRLSRLGKRNIEAILKKPEILSKISNSTCDERAHSFKKIYVNIEKYHNSFFSHCEQNSEVAPLISLYFNLKK